MLTNQCQSKRANLLKMLKRKEERLSKPEVDQLPEHTTCRRRDGPGRDFRAALCIFACKDVLATKDGAGGYSPRLLSLVCARLCDANPMGTREVFSFSCLYVWMHPFA